MTPDELIESLKVAGKLKTTYRHCETTPGRRESVGEHSWRVALMALLLANEPEFADVDMNKVVRMGLLHDLGEAFTGDVPSFYKTDENVTTENAQFHTWLASFSDPNRSELLKTQLEIERMETREARVFKALDKLEAVLSHVESNLSSWAPHEFFMQYSYGRKESAFSEYLTKVKDVLDEQTKRKVSSEAPEKAERANRLPPPEAEYVFRLCRAEEIRDVFQIILDRMKWMDEVGIDHWNNYHYDELFPLSHYETKQKASELFVLEKREPNLIVATATLLEHDARWPDKEPALYAHNFAAKVGEHGAGALFLLFAEDLAKRRGKKYLRVDVLERSDALFRYYESAGFVKCGTCVDGFYRGVLYQKLIQ